MNAKVLHPFFLENSIGLYNLSVGHTILGVTGIVHDAIGKLIDAARVIAAAYGIRQGADLPLIEINVTDVIKINDSPDLSGIAELFRRSIIGSEHNLMPLQTNGVREHELTQRRAVRPTAVFLQNFDQEGVGGCLDSKVLAEARVPGKGLPHVTRLLADSLFIIYMEGRGIPGRNLFCLFPGQKRDLIHQSTSSVHLQKARSALNSMSSSSRSSLQKRFSKSDPKTHL